VKQVAVLPCKSEDMKYSMMKALVLASMLFLIGCSSTDDVSDTRTHYRPTISESGPSVTSTKNEMTVILSSPNIPRSMDFTALFGVDRLYQNNHTYSTEWPRPLYWATNVPGIHANDSVIINGSTLTFTIPDSAKAGTYYWKFWLTGTPTSAIIFDTTILTVRLI
jgi:hypothetical protein